MNHTDKQVEALAQIFTGKLGGMPWEIMGPTAEVLGLVKAKITIEGRGRKSTFRAAAGGLSVAAEKTNWILYEFDWANG